MAATPAARGRPRDRHIDAAVLAAVADVLDGPGYAALAFEDVARRAGVSKAAVYRRWPHRSRLALAVLRERTGAVTAPDTGCTPCDLHEVLELTSRVYCSLGAGTLAQLLAETGTDDGLRAELLAVVIEPVRAVVHRTLHRARLRGDLRADTDLALSADTLCSLVFHRLLLDRNPLGPGEITTVVTGVLRGIAAEPGAVPARYRTHAAGHGARAARTRG